MRTKKRGKMGSSARKWVAKLGRDARARLGLPEPTKLPLEQKRARRRKRRKKK